jgi:hypothetical protein
LISKTYIENPSYNYVHNHASEEVGVMNLNDLAGASNDNHGRFMENKLWDTSDQLEKLIL